MLINLQRFIDFVMTPGTGKFALVRKPGASAIAEQLDFHFPVRDTIVDMHRKGLDTSVLDDFVNTLVDDHERRIFPKVVRGYRKFLSENKGAKWFEPPLREYPIGAIRVLVAPECGLLLGGRPHVVSLYMRGDPLTPQRAMFINHVVQGAFAEVWPGVTFATLDVRRANLHIFRFKAGVAELLRQEANSFEALHSAIGA